MRVRSVLASVVLAAAMVGGAAATASADYSHDSHNSGQYIYCAGNDSLINLPLLNILDFGSGNACQFVGSYGYTG